MNSLLRKLAKASKGLRDPLYRRALSLGVAPSYEHRAMLASLGHVGTVVDVGANVGQFALIARRCLPQARILSFEPLPDAADRFAQALAGQAEVQLFRTALGTTRTTLPIHITARADSSSMLSPALQSEVYPGTHEVGVLQVKVARLDQVITADDIRGPALLKIDVQGYEQQVLEGCETLLPRFDWIFAELSFVELYSGQTLAPEVIGWLDRHGFCLDGVYASDMSYRKGRMIQGDFLFHRKPDDRDSAPTSNR